MYSYAQNLKKRSELLKKQKQTDKQTKTKTIQHRKQTNKQTY